MACVQLNGGVSKVFVSREEVGAFNRAWPCSELRDSRSYWFEFDMESGELVDTDVPEHDDGRAALAMAADCLILAQDGIDAPWMV